MSEFLTTRGVAFQLETIVTGARKRLVLVSPYLQLSQTVYERLRDADGRAVKITLIYGKGTTLDRDHRSALAKLDQLSAYFLENLHAKCYFNEARMVITSMNLYEFSEKTNHEMGVLLTIDKPAYRDAVAEVWTKIEIEVRGNRARLHVHDQEHPTLIVNDVKSGASGKGGIAL